MDPVTAQLMITLLLVMTFSYLQKCLA
jgi:hypothetical protein